MDFSIIVPVYNIEKYIGLCIDSLLCQRNIQYEIILIDDGSQDRSGKICDQYAEQYPIIKVIHKKNGGLSDARNTGIKCASGKYILFVDGDDFIQKDSLLEIKKVIEKNNCPDMICLELTKFSDDSEHMVPMHDGVGAEVNSFTGDELYEYFARLPKYPASACTKAIKRTLFLENDLEFKTGISSEDLDWGIKVFLAVNTVAYCQVPYYFYRQARKGSISNTMNEKKIMDILETIERWSDFAKAMPEGEKKKMVRSFNEYSFRLLFLYYDKINLINRADFQTRLKRISWILGTRVDRASRMMRFSYKFLGLSVTAVLLKKYLYVRGF